MLSATSDLSDKKGQVIADDIDLDALFGGSSETPIHPRDVFSQLPKASRFGFLRDVQADVLDGWMKDPDRADVIVKLNTGAGKTTTGLLILQSSLNANVGPAVYLAPDRYLVGQVIAEAGDLGIAVTDDAADTGFRRGSAVLVTTVHKLFNGRSVFGVGSSGVKINIGSLVIDDAHASLATVADQFRAELPMKHPAYGKIGELFSSALEDQSPSTTLAIRDNDPQKYLEVPFWAVQERADDLLQILHEHRETDELRFVYPFLADHLSLCRVVVGGQGIEIAPLLPLPHMIPAFRAAKRRIYMSATLADDSVFVTHFGAEANKLGDPVTPPNAHAMGDRMILLPQDLDRDITRDEIKKLLVELATEKNVVILAPSGRAAKDWQGIASQVLVGDNVSAGVNRLQQGEHAGLTVLVNRYDGIDLPHNACRVLS